MERTLLHQTARHVLARLKFWRRAGIRPLPKAKYACTILSNVLLRTIHSNGLRLYGRLAYNACQ